MRVVILAETFSKKMGYAENMLSKHLARLGIDVHVVVMNLPPYYQLNDFKETYDDFSTSDELVPGIIENFEGYTLHVMGHRRLLGYMRMEGMWDKLKSLRPNIVQTFSAIGYLSVEAALAKPSLGYKLFTGNHTTASVFPLANRKAHPWDRELIRSIVTRSVLGRFVSFFTEKCYGATIDCADVAVRFFGVQKQKIEISPLGVDTEIFRPMNKEDESKRMDLRNKFGFSGSDIVCIYTGRFSEDKNPLLLAKAIECLSKTGEPFRGLFFGNGVQADAIRNSFGCVVYPFVPTCELGNMYRSADIGVWPTQESTSMIDAAACGLPIVVNNTLVAVERIEGNGITYKLNDVDDLVRALCSLRDPQERKRLGDLGAQKMAAVFSWDTIARRRILDYADALNVNKTNVSY